MIQLTAKLLNNVNLTVNHTESTYTVIGSQQEQGVISIQIPGTAQVVITDHFIKLIFKFI